MPAPARTLIIPASGSYRLLVCGGRNFNERALISHALDPYINQIALIIHGDAAGADQLAEEWANAHQIPTQRFPAQWAKYGKHAGPIRNKEMLLIGKPNYVVAFPGGAGTANMIAQARLHGIPVVEVQLASTLASTHMAWCRHPSVALTVIPCAALACPWKDGTGHPPRPATASELFHCGRFQMTETSTDWSTARHVAPPNTVTTSYDPDA